MDFPMSLITRRIATATSVMLVAGLGVISAPTAATADEDTFCPGMSAPRNTRIANQAPVPGNDTARVLAGSSVLIKVLANDTDADGDRVYVANTTNPRRGETCIDAKGVVEYLAAPSASNYTEVITYGVTDGDLYRTATITVSVEGLIPVRPQLKKRLLLKKGSKAVKRRAVVAFRNANPKRSVLLLAGSIKSENPGVERFIAAGQTTQFKTKVRRLVYITVLRAPDDEIVIVSLGLLNTRNGSQFALAREKPFTRAEAEVLAKRWLR
jgi:hypothetical protein